MTATHPKVTRQRRHFYRFTSEWLLDEEPDRVTDLLADVPGYPAWWSVFIYSDEISDGRGRAALRSVLPLTLKFTLDREVEDRETGLLRARAGGDIDGIVEWKVSPTPSGCRADFLQEVELRHTLARPVDAILRPILEWNHAVAMRRGARGLAAYLASHRG